MSIFDGLNKTPTQKRYEQILIEAKSSLEDEERKCLDSYRLLWGTDDSPTSKEEVAEVLALLGSDATQMFQSHQAWQQFIKTINPDWEILESCYPLNFHEDGSVTLKDEE